MKDQITVPCRYCKMPLTTFVSDVDRLLRCTRCGLFTKVLGQEAKRIELKCPECQTPWNISAKLRGSIYQCWNCGVESPILNVAQLSITDAIFDEQMEQGGQNKIRITLTNTGTSAQIKSFKASFIQDQIDVTDYYQIASENLAQDVDYQAPIFIDFIVTSLGNTPAGITTLMLQIEGVDVLDNSSKVAMAELQWVVCYQRIFIIESMNEFKEKAGVPFTLQLWACLPNGEVDVTYEGQHHIEFQYNSTITPHTSPELPKDVDLIFQQGTAVTPQFFTLYDTTDKLQVSAIEMVPGGPKGISETILTLPNDFYNFDIQLQSPQTDHCPFHGKNIIRAVDQYGNIIENFAEDIWIHPANNRGEIELLNATTNVIPASSFRAGMVDLTGLSLTYNAPPKDFLPLEVSFIISYQNYEECSESIFIEPTPIQIVVSQFITPEAIERGEGFEATLEISNKSKFDLKINPSDFKFVFIQSDSIIENCYKLQPSQMQIMSVANGSKISLPIIIEVDSQCPFGQTECQVTISAYDPVNAWYGRAVGKARWNIVPSGREFRLIEPSTTSSIEAGIPFAITLATYWQDNLDFTYSGKHTIICEYQATESPNNTPCQIPSKLDIEFIEGVGKTNPCFIFTNASENAILNFRDPEAGGPKSEDWYFAVRPGALEFFLITLQPELINSHCFDESNQIMAMDSFGNLILDFNQNCQIVPAHKRGEIRIDGQNTNVIPGTIFQQGIADLNSLKISYHSHVAANLPDSEEFIFICNYKKTQSKPVTILPRPGQLNIVRCSAPEEVEQSGEDYPIYIELENLGDRTVDISSVLFTFGHKNEDISTYYSIKTNPNNNNVLTAGIPLQIVYTVKVSNKAPVGTTDVLVKVSGIDSQSKIPMQTTTQFQWKIEPKQRFFRVTTEHENQETVGSLFSVKISSYLENQQKDPSLHGEYTLEFASNATPVNNHTPNIPNRMVVSFIRGEATTSQVFKFFNAGESPFIQVKDSESRAQGHTGPIRLNYDPSVNLQIHLDTEITNTKQLRGQNTIVISDVFGNVKKNFQGELTIQFSQDYVYFANAQGNKISTLRGDYFRDGVIDLTSKEIYVYCQDESKLPTNLQAQVLYQNKVFSSNSVHILPSPILVNCEKLEVPEKVIPGRPFKIQLEITNRGSYPISIGQINLSLYQGDSVYRDYQINRIGDNNAKIPSGLTTVAYQVQLGAKIGYGKILGKISLNITNASNQKVSLPDMPFSIYVEATGRVFQIATENNNREIAGSPFFLYITAILDNEIDVAYEGSHQIFFKSNATPSPNNQLPIIPENLTVSFSKGKAISPKEFYLFQTQDNVELQVREPHSNTTGSLIGISVLPGEFGKFHFVAAEKQIHFSPFTGENILTAYDVFGNIQHNFQGDVKLYCKSKKGKLSLANIATNVIPRSQFQNGIAEITNLGICYVIEEVNSLPLVDQMVASYQDKDFVSNEITIAPRPAVLNADNIKLAESFYQGATGIPLSFIVKNTGDSKVILTAVKISLKTADNDITPQFNIIPHPQNRTMLLAQSELVLNFFLDAAANAHIGYSEVTILIQGKDSEYDNILEVKAITKTQVLEKLREFKIESEHNNQEIAGVPFSVKLVATKDREPDHTYHGPHEISFSLESKIVHRFAPSFPQKETIQFARGYGQSSQNFILTDTTERICIKAEEKGKASGTSSNITLSPAKMRSFKISFPKDKSYQLQPLDMFDNVLPQQYHLDEDVKTGSILSGTSGMFYEVQELVGHGAMGKVFRGRRLNDNLEVAIKTTLFSNLSDINRFLLEGITLIRFNHPNIVKGYDLRQLSIQDTNRVYCKLFMVMEYLPGQTAKDILDSSKSGIIAPLYATKIILHSARALAYMWENETLHRDIKPENIQITQKDEIKLIDLGIAQARSDVMDVVITQRDTIVGSYPYLSPERLKEGNIVDFRSDMYSLGATYYQLLCGMPPYIDLHKDSKQELLKFLLDVRTKKMPTPIQQLVPVPNSVAKVVTTMIDYKAQKRYQSPGEMINSLESLYQELLANK